MEAFEKIWYKHNFYDATIVDGRRVWATFQKFGGSF